MRHFLSTLIILAGAFFISSCDKHTWEDKTDANGNVQKGAKRLYLDSHKQHKLDEKKHAAEHKVESKKDGAAEEKAH